MDQHQLARIRLLSSRFLELQGLRVAFAGATTAFVLGGYLVVAQPTNSGALIAMFVALVLMIPGEVWLHRYYATRVGRQVPKPRNLAPARIFLLIYFVITVYLNRRFPAIPAGAPTAAIVGLASLYVAIRDWPCRAYYVGATVAVAIPLIAPAFGTGSVDPGVRLATTFFLMGLSFVPIGLLDHRLLVRLMQEARVPEPTIQR